VACSTIAITSVNLQVLDDSGAVVPGVVATWDDGSGPKSCDALTESEFACGYEVAGSLAIHVEAPGFQAFDQTVEVSADECHVQGQSVKAVLSAVSCTTEEVPAVVATVEGAGGEALDQVAVSWDLANADMAAQPCSLQGDGSWQCAPETTGDLEIQASASGHVTQTLSATVALDDAGCHPVTQTLDFQMQWSPD
jgi:hypothetical protein